jgi:GNAT superfamily N-acetyltransferase
MNTCATTSGPLFEVKIAPFIPEHTGAVGQLISAIQREEFQIPITLDQQPDLADIPGYYQNGNGNFWVAVIDQRVIGTISLLDIGNQQVALRKMFVDADFRGPRFGTARKLLEAALEWCRAKGISEVYLGTTAKFLAAHRFYEKNGFTEIAKADLPETFPVMNVDTKFYMMKFHSCT